LTNILGISAFYHDSAAALVCDGVPFAAAQEERFTRRKHCADFPTEAIRFALSQAELAPSDVDSVVFYDKPLLKLRRLVATHLSYAPRGLDTFTRAFSTWVTKKGRQRAEILRELEALGFERGETRLLFSSHHESHAASAFYPSPFESAAVLTMDGVGEWATTTIGHGIGSNLEVLKELRFPHSLGLLYSAFTDFTGFKVNSAEYKVMGLAPYGEPRFTDLIMDEMIDLKHDGSFRLNMEYFDFPVSGRMTSGKFHAAIGRSPRPPEEDLTQVEMDLAASVQAVTEEVVIRVARNLRETSGEDRLCLAGGVALNCVANGKLKEQGVFRDIWVQPAAGDAGGALGAAMLAHHRFHGHTRSGQRGQDLMNGSYLGPEYSLGEIEQQLSDAGAAYEVVDTAELIERTVTALVEGSAIGWFQGRMEFGPRALGNRSIIADPRNEMMQKTLNLKVKYRESFRPFAPSVLRDDLSAWFQFEGDSPYMLMVAKLQDALREEVDEDSDSLFGIDKLQVRRSAIPAVTHVDYSARLHSVTPETNPIYHSLLSSFKARTGCPILVNTSFNVRGEPIVCTPTDAYRCFMGTELDLLVIGNCVLEKTRQDPAKRLNYEEAFELD
jgi:carbamoyltransferase